MEIRLPYGKGTVSFEISEERLEGIYQRRIFVHGSGWKGLFNEKADR
jgi:hypothetical protein